MLSRDEDNLSTKPSHLWDEAFPEAVYRPAEIFKGVTVVPRLRLVSCVLRRWHAGCEAKEIGYARPSLLLPPIAE
jgi:hypothetical protein